MTMDPVPTDRESLWNRAFVFHFLASFFLAVSLMAVMTVMPLYVAGALRGDNAMVGMATTMFALSAVLVRPFMGYLLDTMDRRKLFLAALCAVALFHAAHALIAGFAMLLILRFLHGVPWGGAQTASSTIAADLIPASRRGEGIGYFGLTFTFAGAIGPFASLTLLEATNFTVVFLSASALGLIALVLASIAGYPERPVARAPFALRAIIEYRIGWIALATLITTTSWGIVMSFAALFSKAEHLPHPGVYFTLDAIGTFLSRFRAGHLFDRYGPRWLLTGGYAALIASLLLLGIAPTTTTYVASALLLGLSYGVIVPVTMAMTINLVEDARRGTAMATLFSSFDIGVGVGAVVFGVLATAEGYRVMWIAAGGLLIVPALLFWLYIIPRYETRVVTNTDPEQQ